MSLLQIDNCNLDTAQLARLTQQGPVIVTHDDVVTRLPIALPHWLR